MMKRLTAVLLSCIFLFGMAAAEGRMTGAWKSVTAEPQALPEDAQAAFDKATASLLGAAYTPVALLSTQVVAGTNYCILCQITPVVPDAVPTWNLVYIHAAPDGSAEILNIWEIYIDRHVMEEEAAMQMTINDTPVAVSWEDNESVAALRELAANGLTIQMSMYGGFEQVGAIGQQLPSQDVQTAASAGDIVLYSSSQIVVFYGSNSWAYTRLGKITDRTAEEMKELLGHGDVTITLTAD